MAQVLYILAGAAFTVLCCLALGRLLMDRLSLNLSGAERLLLSFPVGAACLHLIVFLLASARLARKGVFIGVGVVIFAAAWRFRRNALSGVAAAPLPRVWKAVFVALFTVFGVVYLVNALAPEHSPDGVTYHLGLVARYARDRGFRRITTNMYANLSQGVEMLYLVAFSVGRHSAAALTHLAFLVWLPLAMLTWARREGFPVAGAAAALFVFLSPVVGRDGTAAYNDVAVAAILFAVFWLVELWRARQDDGLLALAGLMAGFAYAAKYTAFLAVPYVLGCVAWRLRGERRRMARAVLIVGLCSAAMMTPWLAKNAAVDWKSLFAVFERVVPQPAHPCSVRTAVRRFHADFRRRQGLAGHPARGDPRRAGAGGRRRTVVPAGAVGAAGPAHPGRTARVAGGGGVRHGLSRQHRDPIPDPGAAVRGSGPGPGGTEHARRAGRAGSVSRAAVVARHGGPVLRSGGLADNGDSAPGRAPHGTRRSIPYAQGERVSNCADHREGCAAPGDGVRVLLGRRSLHYAQRAGPVSIRVGRSAGRRFLLGPVPRPRGEGIAALSLCAAGGAENSRVADGHRQGHLEHHRTAGLSAPARNWRAATAGGCARARIPGTFSWPSTTAR